MSRSWMAWGTAEPSPEAVRFRHSGTEADVLYRLAELSETVPPLQAARLVFA